jgi:hypothetical protein
VGSGDDDRLAPPKKALMQDLRQGPKWDVMIEHVLEFDIAARNGVADDHQIRTSFKIALGVRLGYGNLHSAQQVRHGRISRSVRAGDVKSALLQEASEGSHRCAANANEMYVFAFAQFSSLY